jgi:hypothetical protein
MALYSAPSTRTGKMKIANMALKLAAAALLFGEQAVRESRDRKTADDFFNRCMETRAWKLEGDEKGAWA